MAKPAKLRVVERKLGREKAAGQCRHELNLIEIDPRQDSLEYLDTMIHEMLHLEFPTLPEEQVAKIARRMSKALWKQRYRRLQT